MSKTLAADSSLRVEKLRKQIGTFELRADFRIPAGKRAALLGSSGGGKTSLLRLLAGLDEPDSGRIFLGETELTELSPQQRGAGLIFQDQALFPALSVLDNVVFGLRMHGMGKVEREAEGRRWLARVGLESAADSKIGRLSGGERQRVAFVRATIWKPRFLLLDEPFSALDTGLRGQLRQELLKLHELWPVPLLLVTHDEQDALALADMRLHIESTSAGAVREIRAS